MISRWFWTLNHWTLKHGSGVILLCKAHFESPVLKCNRYLWYDSGIRWTSVCTGLFDSSMMVLLIRRTPTTRQRGSVIPRKHTAAGCCFLCMHFYKAWQVCGLNDWHFIGSLTVWLYLYNIVYCFICQYKYYFFDFYLVWVTNEVAFICRMTFLIFVNGYLQLLKNLNLVIPLKWSHYSLSPALFKWHFH